MSLYFSIIKKESSDSSCSRRAEIVKCLGKLESERDLLCLFLFEEVGLMVEISQDEFPMTADMTLELEDSLLGGGWLRGVALSLLEPDCWEKCGTGDISC